MSLDAELYEERRRKWRRSGFWRGVGLTVLILIGLGVLGALLGDPEPRGPHVARHVVSGIIVNDPDRTALIADMAEDDDVRALILYIESPGGTTVGSEALYEAVRLVAEEKPVVAVMGEIAASGGYITALAADHIVARGNTLTGSIGVIIEYPRITGLMEQLGIEWETVRSGDVKGGISPFRDTTAEERAIEQAIVEDSYDWFVGLVTERRGLSGGALETVTDGRVFTGRQAIEAGLIDAIGGQREAESWLADIDPALSELPVRTVSLPEEDPGLADLLLSAGGLDDLVSGGLLHRYRRLLSVTE
ncbi:MAG: signal peptide peptidase SppA [Rubricella sp.]